MFEVPASAQAVYICAMCLLPIAETWGGGHMSPGPPTSEY